MSEALPRSARRLAVFLSWQRKALATGLFVGTHLDVEPYALRAWDTRRDKVIERFARMLERVQDTGFAVHDYDGFSALVDP